MHKQKNINSNKNSNILYEKAREYNYNRISDEMAHLVMLWTKYKHFDITSYEGLVSTVIDGFLCDAND